MTIKRLHQAVNTLLPGDATSDQVLLMRRWLREFGIESEIYALYCDPKLRSEVRSFSVRELERDGPVVFHHTMGSDALARLAAREVPLILMYHNITPPHFFDGTDAVLAEQLRSGREQLFQIRPITQLALSASPYSEQELIQVGFRETGVLPIVLDESQYDLSIDDALFDSFRSAGPMLLFVGRVSPNKRQEDLIKLLYYYRRIEPRAHLVLVGSVQAVEYVNWLKKFAAKLRVADHVTFAGHVSQQEMVTYFKAADLFVSMSEHEGFGKPLIESMYLDLPVMAFASTAVPSTLGDAGILFRKKNYEALAELVDMVVSDQEMRRRLIAGQRARVQMFLEVNVRRKWREYLQGQQLL
jgi:L-malate glycosyltransferase